MDHNLCAATPLCFFFIDNKARMPSSYTTQLRKSIQTSAQNGDLPRLRTSIDAMYGDESPFKNTKHHMTAPTLNPIIEGAILSKLSNQQEAFDELKMDIQHIHRAFGVTAPEYELINTFLDDLQGPRHNALDHAREHFKNTRYHKLKFVQELDC